MPKISKILPLSVGLILLICIAKDAACKIILILLGLIGLVLLLIPPALLLPPAPFPVPLLNILRPRRSALINALIETSPESTFHRNASEISINLKNQNQKKSIINSVNHAVYGEGDIINDILNTNQHSLLNQALKYDPKGCAQMLICRAATLGSYASLFEIYLLGVVQQNLNQFKKEVPKGRGSLEFSKAIQYAYQFKDPNMCSYIYNRCPYSPEQMWNFLSI